MADLDPAPVADPTDPTPAAADPAPQPDPTPDPAPVADPAPKPEPEDWRSRLSGGDEKILKYLGKFQSEAAFAADAKKKNDALLNKASAPKLPENPTPEELAAYRKEMGIPDKPEDYLTSLPNGLVVGDDDRPFVDQFLEKMHGVNAHPSVTAAALDAYYGIVEEQETAQAEADSNADMECVTALKDEWGADYKRNANVLRSFLGTMPESVAEAITQARGPDGKILSMNADVIKWLTGKALEENPLATVVPGFSDQPKAIEDEIASIEKVMRENRPEYNRDEKMQARYRELIEARLKHAGTT